MKEIASPLRTIPRPLTNHGDYSIIKQMIGLKLADGSFYPVLEEGVAKTKKLTLTTARDNQETVHIVLVKGEPGDSGGDLSFIRELFLSGLERAPGGDPDIELTLSLNDELQLSSRLNPLGRPPEEPRYEAPRGIAGGRVKRGKKSGKGYEDNRPTLKYWESFVPSDTSDEEFAASGVFIRPNAVSLTAFVLLGLFICAVLAFVFFEVFQSPPAPPLGAAAIPPVFGKSLFWENKNRS
jgi:hypothetical protein